MATPLLGKDKKSSWPPLLQRKKKKQQNRIRRKRSMEVLQKDVAVPIWLQRTVVSWQYCLQFQCCTRTAGPSAIQHKAPNADPASIICTAGCLQWGRDETQSRTAHRGRMQRTSEHRAPFFWYSVFNASGKWMERGGSELLMLMGFGCCSCRMLI